MKIHAVLLCSTVRFKTKSIVIKCELSKIGSNWSNASEVLLIVWPE